MQSLTLLCIFYVWAAVKLWDVTPICDWRRLCVSSGPARRITRFFSVLMTPLSKTGARIARTMFSDAFPHHYSSERTRRHFHSLCVVWECCAPFVKDLLSDSCLNVERMGLTFHISYLVPFQHSYLLGGKQQCRPRSFQTSSAQGGFAEVFVCTDCRMHVV